VDQQQQTPQWSPPPQQPAGWGSPSYSGPPVRPTGVTLAGIYLIVMGILVALFLGGCSMMVGGSAASLGGDLANVVGGSIAVFGLICLVVGIAGVAAGAGAMTGSGWARWTGIIVSVVSILFFGLLMLGSFSTRGGTGLAISFGVVVVLYVLVVWIFISANSWFAARRR
jgi:hypothetical protein